MAVLMAALGACSSTTPAPTVGTPPSFTPAISGTAQKDASGNYFVTQNGVVRALGKDYGVPYFSGSALTSATNSAYFDVLYATADVFVVAGQTQAVQWNVFAGINGTLSTTVPTTGSATAYTGEFGVIYTNGSTTPLAHGAFTTTVNFNAGTLTGTGTDTTGTLGSLGAQLTVNGNLQGAQFNGTATFTATGLVGSGTNVPVTGGFYGAGNTVAGIVQNADITGVFYGN
jgi:hypothetical protein